MPLKQLQEANQKHAKTHTSYMGHKSTLQTAVQSQPETTNRRRPFHKGMFVEKKEFLKSSEYVKHLFY